MVFPFNKSYKMEISNFTKLISQIEAQPDFFSQLPAIEQDYLVKIYKITELNVQAVQDLYTTMQKKFYLNRRTSNEQAWYQNELRIFIWLLFGYLHVHHKSLERLTQDDWNFFSPIFNHKSTVFFQFQSLSLLRPHTRPAPWVQQQTALLQIIISEKNYKNRWNSIARELFIRSGKRFFRNPKQCRERWMNHLDPSKLHTQWTPSEDLTLLTSIKKKGKRWSVAMKELGNTRTEHMVKNRYKSLISNQSKRYPGKKESELQNILIKKLNKTIDKHTKESSFKEIKEPKEPEESPKIIFKGQSPQVKCQKEQKLDLNFSLQMKPIMKEDLKIEDDHLCFNFSDNIGGDFHQFGVNSPMFIPWNDDERKERFDMSQDRFRNDHFCPNMSQYNSDDLPF